MALQAGRVGVAPDQVDIFGNIKKEVIKPVVDAVKAELIGNFPLLGKKWYNMIISCDGTDYTVQTDFAGELEIHTSTILLPAGINLTAFFVGVNEAITGSASATTYSIGIQYGYTNGKTGIKVPAKSNVFNLKCWFCVD